MILASPLDPMVADSLDDLSQRLGVELMIARSPTGSALLVHLRAEVMHRSYPILVDTLRRIEYLTTQTSIADLASLILS